MYKMADLKGSKTEANLQAAFAGESQAHTKYQYFAAKAKEEGYVQIHDIFMETSKNEREHAKIWYKLLHDEEIPDLYLQMLKQNPYSKKKKKLNGNVKTVDSFSKVLKHLKCVLFVEFQKHTSKKELLTSNKLLTFFYFFLVTDYSPNV